MSVDVAVAVALAVFATAVYLSSANYGPAQANDTRAAAIASWSLGTRGTAELPSNWIESNDYWAVRGRGGRLFVNRFPGVAYWAAPAYAVAGMLDASADATHPLLVDPGPAAATAAVTSATVVGLLYLLLRTEVGQLTSAVAAGTMALGTSLWSVASVSLWPHAPAMLCLVAALLGWRRSQPILVTLFCALAVLVRPQLVVALAVLAAHAWSERRSQGVAFAAGGVLGLALLSFYTYWAFGNPLPVAGYTVGTHLDGLIEHSPWQTISHLVLAFASPDRGIIPASPVILGAGVALVLFSPRLPRWTAASALAGFVYLVVLVRTVGYRGGDGFFGYRVSLEFIILAVPALALSSVEFMRRYTRAVPILAALLVVSIAIQSFGAVVGGVSPEQQLRWKEIQEKVRVEQDLRSPPDLGGRLDTSNSAHRVSGTPAERAAKAVGVVRAYGLDEDRIS